MSGGLEPDSTGPDRPMSSIAISLKRIADAMTAPPPTIRTMSPEAKAEFIRMWDAAGGNRGGAIIVHETDFRREPDDDGPRPPAETPKCKICEDGRGVSGGPVGGETCPACGEVTIPF